MSSLIRFYICMLFLLPGTQNSLCGSVDSTSPSTSIDPKGPGWLTGERVNFGGILFPHLHAAAVYGGTTIKDGHEAATGHHDPITDGWTIQGFEAGATGRFGNYLETFGVAHLSQDAESGDWDLEAEEYFAKLKNLPGGLELRGGRYLNRLGFHNSQHQHAWDWSDNYLVSGRFLGDDGLYSMGGELSWTLPLDSLQWESVVSVSVGDAQPEAHEHGEEPDPEPRYEAAGAAWQSTLTAINWTSVYNYNDFHQWRFGISGVFGENAWNRDSNVYGAHAGYQWRQNGLEPGGRYFRWSNEAMLRHIDALSGPLPGEPTDANAAKPRAGSFHEWGCYSQVIYGLPTGLAGPLEMGLRMDYVQGVQSAGLPERLRLSPSVRLFANTQRTASLAVHYNMDDIADRGTEHSLWLSIALNWGGPEVR